MINCRRRQICDLLEFLAVRTAYKFLESVFVCLKIKIKRNELDKIENCEEEYDKLMDEKINVLKLQGDYFTKEKIRLLDEKLNEYLKINEDIRKTHKIGKNLLEEVKLAKHDLECSKKWKKIIGFTITKKIGE